MFAESLVIQHYLEKGYRLCYQRKKLFGVEFDLIFRNQNETVYVEVKSIKSAAFFVQRWPLRQKKRFLKVASFLAERENSSFYLGLVNYENKIFLFNISDLI